LRKRLGETLPQGSASAYKSFDIIGDIAITKLPTPSPENAKGAAEAIMKVHRNVKAIFVQTSPVAGDFRLRGLTHIAGENRTLTFHRESGCAFAVDVETCYFSPRLSHERMRIAQLVQPGETVVNMFAGAGCFSVVIARHSQTAKVYSIDVNPAAVQFMRENVRLNRVYGRVVPLLGDAKAIIETHLMHCADRVLMPLPEKAFEYLPVAVSALKAQGGWIHYHGFEHAEKNENPKELVELRVAEKLASLGVGFELPFSRVARTVGPNRHHVVVDVHIGGLGKS
jgi:tRNA (guanine37-N1)-methyltransferase